MRADLPKQHVTSSALQGLQSMTNDYITGKTGFYMTLESFSNSRKCERTIAKIKFLVPIHLLDYLIIPIHVRDSHWFPAHMDVKSRCMGFSGLESHLQLCRLLTAENAFMEILQTGMDSPR